MDELLGRRVPYSAQAEQAVLGSMLIDSRCIADVIGRVKADDFYVQGGACSLLCKEYREENCVLTGVPGKVVKQGIDWKKERI